MRREALTLALCATAGATLALLLRLTPAFAAMSDLAQLAIIAVMSFAVSFAIGRWRARRKSPWQQPQGRTAEIQDAHGEARARGITVTRLTSEMPLVITDGRGCRTETMSIDQQWRAECAECDWRDMSVVDKEQAISYGRHHWVDKHSEPS